MSRDLLEVMVIDENLLFFHSGLGFLLVMD